MNFAKLNTVGEFKTLFRERRLKVCAVAVNPGQTGQHHDDPREKTDVTQPHSVDRVARPTRQSERHKLRWSPLDRHADPLPKQTP